MNTICLDKTQNINYIIEKITIPTTLLFKNDVQDPFQDPIISTISNLVFTKGQEEEPELSSLTIQSDKKFPTFSYFSVIYEKEKDEISILKAKDAYCYFKPMDDICLYTPKSFRHRERILYRKVDKVKYFECYDKILLDYPIPSYFFSPYSIIYKYENTRVYNLVLQQMKIKEIHIIQAEDVILENITSETIFLQNFTRKVSLVDCHWEKLFICQATEIEIENSTGEIILEENTIGPIIIKNHQGEIKKKEHVYKVEIINE